MRVVFAGTPEFAREALTALHTAGFTIPLVLTQPDRPAGRGMQLQASPVKQFALDHAIPVLQPSSLRRDGKYPQEACEALAQLQATPHDVMVVAAYGLILPQYVLDIPPHGCLNIHASLLPRWRGAAPIHRAIEAGDAETGITIMQMDAGLDTGPMLMTAHTPIAADDTTSTLHDKLATQGGALIVSALQQLQQQGKMTGTPQPAEGVTYAEKISKAEATLDFNRPAAALARAIRAFSPFPGASGTLQGTPIKFWQAQALDLSPDIAQDAQPGTVLAADAAGVLIACEPGSALRVTCLQKPGGKKLDARPFLQGFPLHPGDRFASS